MKGHIIVDTLEKTWYRQRFFLDEEITVDEFLQGVKEGEINSVDGEYLYDCTQELTVDENDGEATLEIFSETVEPKNLIYSNATNK